MWLCVRARASEQWLWWFGCKGTRASVASSARSLSHYSVSSDLVDSIPEGRSRTTERLGICFHYGGREKLIPPPAHIHTLTWTHTYIHNHPHKGNDCYSSESPPQSFAFIRVPQSCITLWPPLVRVCVSMCVRKYWVDKEECSALFLLAVHVAITVWAQHIGSDVNSWATNL